MLSALVAALAVLVWPVKEAHHRLTTPIARRVVVPQALLVLAACGAAWWFGGVGCLVAVLVLGAAVGRVTRTRAAQRNQHLAAEALAAGVGAVVDELRAGAHPAQAADNAAKDCEAKEVLRAIAATTRLGGDVGRTLRELGRHELARAWDVSARYGVALAEVLDEVRRDLGQRAAFARRVEATMAGPRASAAVLAVLPAFGLLLGLLSGANPLHVLFDTIPGQVLLVTGALLVGAGLLWTTRLTTQAVLP